MINDIHAHALSHTYMYTDQEETYVIKRERYIYVSDLLGYPQKNFELLKVEFEYLAD